MSLVLIMNPNWRQKIVIEHGGEKMEIIIQSGEVNRVKLVFTAPLSWKINRKPEDDGT